MLEGHLPRVTNHQVYNVDKGKSMFMVIYCMMMAIHYTLTAMYYTTVTIFTKVTTVYYKMDAPSCFSTAAQERRPHRQMSGVGLLRAKVKSLKESKQPWREAGPPNYFDDKVDSGQ